MRGGCPERSRAAPRRVSSTDSRHPRTDAALAFLIIVALSSFCRLARADPFHQQTLPLGQRAIGMGGAFTAVADDPSATYYNPAGLVLTDDSSLSASLSLQAFDKTTVQGGYRTTEGITSLRHNAGTSLPVFVSAIKLLGKKGTDGRRRHAVALSSFTVSQRHLSFDLESRGTTATGNGALETLSVDMSDRTVWYGVSYAYRVTRRLSLGLSSFLSILRTAYTEQRISAQLGALDATSHAFASPSNSFTSHEMSTNVKSFVWRLGAHYAWNSRLFFGLMLQTPSVHIRGRASVRDRSLLTDNIVNPGSSSVFNAHQSNLTSNNPTPWELRLGGRYELSDWFTLALDGSVVGPTGSSAHPIVSVGPRTPDAETGALPRVGAFTSETFYRTWSGNVALGASASLPRTITVRAGIYTDLSSAPAVPRYSATYFQPDTNRVGGTLSVGLRNQGFDLSIGTIGVFGRGKGMSFNNESTTNMTYQRTVVTERMFLFFLNGAKSAISTLAKKAEQTIMELKNGRAEAAAREDGEQEPVPTLEPELGPSP